MAQLSETDKADRWHLISLLEQVIQQLCPGATIQVFGSFATDLDFPCSDLDAVINDRKLWGSSRAERCKLLTGLKPNLSRQSWAHNVKVIRASVPIIKLQTDWGIDVDLSVAEKAEARGPKAVDYINREIQTWPELKPLVKVVKLFLIKENLDDVSRGGLSSYAVTLSMLAYIKQVSSEQGYMPEEPDLGVLLRGYFEFLGLSLDRYETGVSPEPPYTFDRLNRDDRLFVRCPIDKRYNAAKSAFDIEDVLGKFRRAYGLLSHTPNTREPRLRQILNLRDVQNICSSQSTWMH